MENKFIDGLFVNKRENAPEFLITSLSFNAAKFIEWLKNNTNANGYCNIDILKAKSGKDYAKKNEWSPEQHSKQLNSIEEKIGGTEVKNIPF